jgi:hypothetical protein
LDIRNQDIWGLFVLRKRLGAYLEISREAIKFKDGAMKYLDHSDLMAKLACGQIEQALEIYRGDFLEAF